MSLLVPVNLSNASKMKRKPDKTPNTMMFACDYPMSAEEVEKAQTTMRAAVGELQAQPNESGGKAEPSQTEEAALRKPRAVPVNLVDPIELLEPDEYGAELGKEARVWKVYVKEADKWDTELVEGWNKSLDVILVFAALFSAISTAFLIESSKKLQQDPSDVSAATLLVISQTLITIANSSSGAPVLLPSEPIPASDFTPPHHAVIVNTMWYLSLSLSVATSLLAMLAKEWCHSFTANRTGHQWDQALRRQRKWTMIERWKMQELIAILPSLIHLSLLLFATGLSIYVWDVNNTAAIPIICITGGLFAFYVWSSIMASFEKLFPYTTIFSRAVHAQSEFLQRQGKQITRRVIELLAWISGHFWWIPWLLLVAVYFTTLLLTAILVYNGVKHYVRDKFGALLDAIIDAGEAAGKKLESFPTKRWYKMESDRDLMTSLALKWLIQNCETPASVAIALQAIAGAGPRIPRAPLESCNSTLHILQRLASSGCERGADSDAKPYLRALEVLGSQKKSPQELEESENSSKTETLIWDLQPEHEGQVVDLIKHTEFLPTKDNVEALTLGTSATSLSLRLFRAGGNLELATQTFERIVSLLSPDIGNINEELSIAAIQSLASAAILLSSCSDAPLFSPITARAFIYQRIRVPRWRPFLGRTKAVINIPQSNNSIDGATALLICILLHHQPTATISGQPGYQRNVGNRVERAAHLLMDERLRSYSARLKFHRVALFEILFHLDQYGLNLESEYDLNLESEYDLNLESEYGLADILPMWCKYYKEDQLLISSTVMGTNRTTESGNGNTEATEFLMAIQEVYDLVGASTIRNAVQILPAPVYCTLIHIACSTRLESEQTLCEKHLSRFAFLRMSDLLATTVDSILPHLWEAYQRVDPRSEPSTESWRLPTTRLRQNTDPDSFTVRSRHVGATQLWLLLYLVGGSSTNQQTELKETIERRTGLEIESEGVYRIKLRLANDILEGYERGHHLGVYSARVVECVLQDSGPRLQRDYADISDRIGEDLNGVSPGLRGLSSFSDPSFSTFMRALNMELPPSPVPSVASIKGADEGDPDKTDDQSKGNHVTIPVLLDASKSEDA